MREITITNLMLLMFVISIGATGKAVAGKKDSVLPVQSTISDLSNIGFMKEPPNEIVTRFPMCDAFLDIKWIDKKKMIGYIVYEAIKRGKRAKYDGERVKLWALIDMQAHRFDFDVYQFMRKGKLEEVFEGIRKGKVRVANPMMITYKGKTISLYTGKATNDDDVRPLLSDYRQTVCAVYPDNQHAWLVEKKKVERVYSEQKINEISERIRRTGTNHLSDIFESFMILDMNFDGKDEYISNTSYFFMYFDGDRLRTIDKKSDLYYFYLSFPSDDRECRVSRSARFTITTDGKNYYLAESCNLTEMTSH